MDRKIVIALALLLVVVIAGGVLIALPTPTGNGNGNIPSRPFTSENINVSSPLPNASVAKTIIVRGEARGTWYFEASFPLEVLDKDGNSIAMSYATAQGEWMTTEFVPFEGEILVQNYSGPATLVLHKDNPSGLPEHDDSVSLPIVIQ
ncbi:hypothetical protein C4585_03295 [Candidatus Parcubacteria bacterium]|nr:MAG: hypothetical protein C4585_03295 [Candidatus Parcubacteria bacterium]